MEVFNLFLKFCQDFHITNSMQCLGSPYTSSLVLYTTHYFRREAPCLPYHRLLSHRSYLFIYVNPLRTFGDP
ncbi:hypothetical protein BRC2024_KCUCJSVR_CDS_0167 [Acinetobacter phage vB_AbaM_KissB]